MRKFCAPVVLYLALIGVLLAGQPAGGDFIIQKSTVDGGGGTSSGGTYVLTATIGQAEAGPVDSSAGNFVHAGGFWVRLAALADFLFKDGFESD